MYYLVDTNVFIHVISDNVFDVADLCKKNGTDITITKTILDELDPGYYLNQEDGSLKALHTVVSNLAYGNMSVKLIRMIDLDDVPGAMKELKKIRDRFYGWMKDTEYLKYLIDNGKITREDIKKKSFKLKDMGECELIAIAKCSDEEHSIVSNDKGRVFLHPERNLFDDYAALENLNVISGLDWLREIEYA